MKSPSMISQAIILTATAVSQCSAFSTSPSIPHTSTSQHHTSQQVRVSRTISSQPLQMATMTADELNTMSKSEQYVTLLGVDDEEKLALGIDPDEVLEFIGTREDLINKFQEDMPQKFASDRSLAEKEVDKLLMDGEMLDLYIKYSQRKAEDPSWEPIMPREESPVQKVIGFISQYAIYLVGGFLLKDVVVGIAKKNDVDLPSWLDGGNTVLPSESVGDVAASGAAADTLVSSVHHLGDHIMV